MAFETNNELYSLLCVLDERQKANHNEIMTVLKRIEGKVIMADETLDQVIAAVTQEETVEAGVETLLAQLKSSLDAITAGALPPATQAKVDSLFTSITNDSTGLSTALTANTPAAPAS